MALNFGPPIIDFSPLGKLGETYDRSAKAAAEYRMNQARQGALASLGDNPDMKALGAKLLAAGDLEGGMSAFRLAESTTSGAASRGIQERQLAETIAEHKRQAEATAEERGRIEAQRAYERERQDRPTRVTKKNEFNEDIGGWRDNTGHIIWDDGTTGSDRGPGPQSGGVGDPNLPAAGGALAQLGGPAASTDPGYFIPSTGQVLPPGTTTPMPGGDAMAAALPATGAAQAQLAPPPAAGAAVAAPAAAPPPVASPAPPAAAGAPVTATMINQGTANIAPMSNAEMIAEARRLGISPAQYRAARAETIKKEMEARTGGEVTTDMKNKLARSRVVAPNLVRELDALAADVKEYGTEYLPTGAKARMETTYTNILMQLKDMYQLGALQAQDLKVVESMLTNPTSSGWNPIEGIYKGFTQKTITREQVAKIKQILNDGLRTMEATHGGRPESVPERYPPSPLDPGYQPPPLDIGKSRDLGGGVTIRRTQ
jgi:hypothetical protein